MRRTSCAARSLRSAPSSKSHLLILKRRWSTRSPPTSSQKTCAWNGSSRISSSSRAPTRTHSGLQHHPLDFDDIVLAEAGQLRDRGRVHVDTAGVSAGKVRGDPSQLLRLVRNLLDNAERPATSTVTIGLRTSRAGVELSIADDGAGVPPEHRARVFDRFTRLDDARARDTGGAGLGLSIVAEVSRAHGGLARLDDSADGARFVVVLPALDLD